MTTDITKQEIKETSAEGLANIQQAVATTTTQNQQLSASSDYTTLHEYMKTANNEFQQTVASINPQTIDNTPTLTKNQTDAQKLSQPVTNKQLGEYGCNIGNFIGSWIMEPTPKEKYYSQVLQKQKELTPHSEYISGKEKNKFRHSDIKHVDVTLDNIAEGKAHFGLLAAYDPATGKVIIQNYDKMAINKSMINNPRELAYFNHNPISENGSSLHEFVHKKHFLSDDAFSFGTTPTNAAKADRLTETSAFAVEYLSAAHQYNQFIKAHKETGSTEAPGFQYTDNEGCVHNMPLEDMLDLYPGLKDVVTKYGFDLNDPQSTRRIVEVASKEWHNTYQKLYDEKQTPNRLLGVNELYKEYNASFSTRYHQALSEDVKHDASANKMLSNLYIGNNTFVDLTHCRDLLDTLTTQDAENLTQNMLYNTPSKETILAVNSYLESKGMYSDKEKDEYLKKAFTNIVNRTPDADIELRKLLTADNPKVLYADGLSISNQNDPMLANINTIPTNSTPTPEVSASHPTSLTSTQQTIKNNQQFTR